MYIYCTKYSFQAAYERKFKSGHDPFVRLPFYCTVSILARKISDTPFFSHSHQPVEVLKVRQLASRQKILCVCVCECECECVCVCSHKVWVRISDVHVILWKYECTNGISKLNWDSDMLPLQATIFGKNIYIVSQLYFGCDQYFFII